MLLAFLNIVESLQTVSSIYITQESADSLFRIVELLFKPVLMLQRRFDCQGGVRRELVIPDT